MIEVNGLTKIFAGVPVVDNLSFKAEKGQILGFLGPNGAGKTTTMKMITGYWPADAGSIMIDDRRANDDWLSAQRLIGYLPENNPLYEDMKVFEYLKFVAEIRDIMADQQLDRIRLVAERCGLNKVIGQPIGQLSKGYKQRVGLAQAIIHQPKILILDEPTTGLDPNQILEIRQLIKDIGREQTVILSTHILSEVEQVCDRLVIVNHGRLVAEGAVASLLAEASTKLYLLLAETVEGAEVKLAALPEIASVERLSDREYLLSPADDQARFAVGRLALEQGWIILEFNRRQAKLEEIFRQLTNV